ncbi:MAG: flagellar biosynthesis protein FlhF [Spirochaetes bacterium]|nr:flagellar biosynthesis protein FlhF [Spirochaetota bacterium]
MKYVKIKSATYNEAMMKLRMDYGEDAIPVSHRYVKEGGILNSKLFAKNLVELTAAIPERNNSKIKSVKKSLVDYTVGDSEAIKESLRNAQKEQIQIKNILNAGIKKEIAQPVIDNILDRNSAPLISSGLHQNSRIKSETGTFNKESIPDYKKFEKEFEEIKATLKMLLEDGNNNRSTFPNSHEEDEFVKPYINILRDNDFDLNERNFLIDEIKKTISPDDMKDRYKIEKSLKDLLKSKIITYGPIKKGIKKKVIMFIGPTGVGKTTTMAKLGAIYALREDYKVAFVTIDTYRIAATEQLKKYAGIMKIPIHVVNDQKAFKDIINNEKSEIILVDTSGRSHKNDLKISEIKSYADMVEFDFEKILCVSANTKKNDLKDIFKAFGKINFNSVIITKVDESSYIGSVINVADTFKKPISYYTNGQEVPNDIYVAEPNKIVDMIIGESTYAGG